MIDLLNKKFTIIGPQGSGKGTQAKTLASILDVPHISTGDVFRDNIIRSTLLGQQVKDLLVAGKLVPDEMTNQLVAERLSQSDAANGFILDGYPRNLAQAEFLYILAPEVKAIVLNLSDDEAVRRIAGRRTCSKCGAIYHIEFNPPHTPNVCDACKMALIQRSDDTELVTRDRLAIYHHETEPLLVYYRNSGRLIEIDGTPAIDSVTVVLRQVLGV